MVAGHALMATAVVLVLFSVGEQTQNLTGLSQVFVVAWNVLRWVLAFLTVNFALAILYYAAPNATCLSSGSRRAGLRPRF